jgi:hypothetical protein
MIKLDGIATFVANNALVPFPNHANLRGSNRLTIPLIGLRDGAYAVSFSRRNP